MDESLIDSDILNEIVKGRNANVTHRAGAYLTRFGEMSISVVTRYEIKRWMLEKRATRQLALLNALLRNSRLLPVDDAVLDRAAGLWVEGRRQGRRPTDADLFIAATALEHDLVLVTGNTKDFRWIPGLVVENWRNP